MRPLLVLALFACNGSDPQDTSVPTDPPPTDTDVVDTDPITTEAFTDGPWTTTVEVDGVGSLTRTYRFQTNHPQRDGGPDGVTVVETAEQPVLRSGSLIFDGLFALAVQEARENSVSAISDGAYAGGAPVPCDCFQTGELWTWVWTRDTAYAADLGLAWLDPERTAASLRFKLSRPKQGGDLRIVQDTGTGGSWPVSTDRAIWALGADAVLNTLTGPAREAFLDDALEAAAATITEDQIYAWDLEDGLMRGEQSFLDWREQSYPTWTASDVVPIAEGKALSTNLAHWILLDAAARWADERGVTHPWRARADSLEDAIQATFWQTDRWATLVGPGLDPSVGARRDWLAESLAALTLASPAQSLSAMSSYPHGPHGPPVIWPQQPGVPVYHNRAQWPFVTAYGMRAAARNRHAAVFEAGAAELVRGAALNLSNMENAEWTTGEPWFEDGDLSGPVVNSRRQLWSVAGYLSFVVDGLFGARMGPDGLTFDPFIPAAVRERWLADTVTLHRFPWHGERLDLTIELSEGAGSVAGGTTTSTSQGILLTPVPVTAQGTRTDVDPADPSAHTAPDEPVLDAPIGGPAGVTLTWGGGPMDVFRDGQRVAVAVGSPWTDPSTAGIDGVSWCYALEARGPGGLASTHSPPRCWWGADGARVQTIDAYGFIAKGGTWSTANGRPHLEGWGAPWHTMRVRFRPNWTGPHAIQWVYANGAGPLNTGITASVKYFEITSLDGSTFVGTGPVVLPHTGGWDVWRESTLARVELVGGEDYELTLYDGPNMTDLEANTSYGGLGGGPDPYRYVDLAELKLLALDGQDQGLDPNALGFDGADDLAQIPAAQVVEPGVPQQPWERFGLEWDAHALYVVWVSEAFEDPFAPAILYIEAGAGGASQGMAYSGLTPELPFEATHAIAVRRQHDAGDGVGPWSGVWTYAGGWTLGMRLLDGRDVWAAADQHTLAVRIPWSQLGDPASVRVAGHVVRGLPGNEWKDTVPAAHTPWVVGGGSSWTIDRSGPHEATAWTP